MGQARRMLWCAGVTVVGISVWGPGCGGNTANLTGVGTPDASAADSPGTDATLPGDGTVASESSIPTTDAADSRATGACPSYSGTDSICMAEVAQCNRCGDTPAACVVSNFTSYCDQYAAVFSDIARQALVSCQPAEPCVKEAGANDPCIDGYLLSGKFSAAQQHAAVDFCTSCPLDAGNCGAFYFFGANGNAGPGFYALIANDSIVQEIDLRCAGAKADAGVPACDVAYLICAERILAAHLPMNPCGDASLGMDRLGPRTPAAALRSLMEAR